MDGDSGSDIKAGIEGMNMDRKQEDEELKG